MESFDIDILNNLPDCLLLQKHSIILLVCYFGEIPWYFRYFIHSCSYNHDIDFVIISDMVCQDELPANVLMSYYTLVDVQNLASQRLGFRVNIDYPYKLCDYKPAYGIIFSEYVAGYDFWGQCDIDLIFGDIRNFMQTSVLDSFDLISVRHDYFTGCFSLHRNNPYLNKTFMKSKDFRKVFSSSTHFCFDECSFAYEPLSQGMPISEVGTKIESFTEVVVKAAKKHKLRVHFDFLLIEGIPGNIIFDKGKVFYKRKFEAILYHMCRFKKVYRPQRIPGRIGSRFSISRTRIY